MTSKNSSQIVLIILLLLVVVLFSSFVGSMVGRIAAPINNGSSLEYKDFISIMLTAISILLALVTVVISVLAVFGWQVIEDKVEGSANNYLKNGFESGKDLHKILSDHVTSETKSIFCNLKDGDPLYEIVRNELREIMYQGVNFDEESSNDGESNP